MAVIPEMTDEDEASTPDTNEDSSCLTVLASRTQHTKNTAQTSNSFQLSSSMIVFGERSKNKQ